MSKVSRSTNRAMPLSDTVDLSDLITLGEGSQLIKIHERTLRRRVSEGQLRAYRVGARSIRVSRSDVLALVRVIPNATA